MKFSKSNITVAITITTALCLISIIKQFNTYTANLQLQISRYVSSQVHQMFLPTMYSVNHKKANSHGLHTFVLGEMMYFLPIIDYYQTNNTYVYNDDELTTYEMILKAQSESENYIDEDGNLVGEDTTILNTSMAEDMDALKDPAKLISKYYIVDRTAKVDTSLFSAEAFMAKDMKLKKNVDGPQILIYHTHSQEAFVDSKKGDPNTSIVGVGEYLSEQLEARGIEVLHHTGVYDLIGGKLDRSKAYDLALKEIPGILEDNPTIELVIDLHRDGVPDTTHLVTKVDGKTTAQIMFFNGLSSTLSNGSISSLQNPYILDNLALSFQMQYAANKLYPGFTRRIYLKSYRYNMHIMPKSMLIEAGAQTNTVEEMMNAMEVLSHILVSVIGNGE